MPTRIWTLALALAIAGCSSSSSSSSPRKGRLVVALTIDWEGAYLSLEGLDALDELRAAVADAPLTHFVSAAYFTKPTPDPELATTIAEAVRPGDELAVHLHAWKSLAVASDLTPKLAPSFLSGTHEVLEFEDGDVGFDTDLDAYDVTELRALLRTSRRLLGQLRLPVSSSFRAGGYLGTPKVLQAIHDEGFTVDSSATDHRQLDERADALPARIKAIWPAVEATTQPFMIRARSGELLEMPIAAFADYTTADEIIGVVEAAHARLAAQPTRDVFVVLGFHLETAADFAGRLREALTTLRARPELAAALVFMTVEKAAQLARPTATPAPK